jgi:hypothetical protein
VISVGIVDWRLVRRWSSDFRWLDDWMSADSWKEVWMKDIYFDVVRRKQRVILGVRCAIYIGSLFCFGSLELMMWDRAFRLELSCLSFFPFIVNYQPL